MMIMTSGNRLWRGLDRLIVGRRPAGPERPDLVWGLRPFRADFALALDPLEGGLRFLVVDWAM